MPACPIVGSRICTQLGRACFMQPCREPTVAQTTAGLSLSCLNSLVPKGEGGPVPACCRLLHSRLYICVRALDARHSIFHECCGDQPGSLNQVGAGISIPVG
jgi:hypothetical protein